MLFVSRNIIILLCIFVPITLENDDRKLIWLTWFTNSILFPYIPVLNVIFIMCDGVKSFANSFFNSFEHTPSSPYLVLCFSLFTMVRWGLASNKYATCVQVGHIVWNLCLIWHAVINVIPNTGKNTIAWILITMQCRDNYIYIYYEF